MLLLSGVPGVGKSTAPRRPQDRVPLSKAKMLALDEGSVYLVDEIGKMECLSSAFVEAVVRLLDSDRPLIATVAQRGAGFITDVKRRPDAELWQVMRDNRDELPARIVSWLGNL